MGLRLKITMLLSMMIAINIAGNEKVLPLFIPLDSTYTVERPMWLIDSVNKPRPSKTDSIWSQMK